MHKKSEPRRHGVGPGGLFGFETGYLGFKTVSGCLEITTWYQQGLTEWLRVVGVVLVRSTSSQYTKMPSPGPLTHQ